MASNSENLIVEEDNTQKIVKQFDAAIEKALTECGLTAENYAKKACPVDTGLLRNSITYALSGKSAAVSSYKADRADKSGKTKSGKYSGRMGSSSEKAVYIGTNVEYAEAVEAGTSTHAAQPYLVQAARDHTDVYKRILKSNLGSV